MYLPAIRGGTVGKRIPLSPGEMRWEVPQEAPWEAEIVVGMESTGPVEYLFVIYVYARGESEPCLCLASERNTQAEAGKGGSHFLGLFHEDRHVNLGSSDEWADLARFTERALEVAGETLGRKP